MKIKLAGLTIEMKVGLPVVQRVKKLGPFGMTQLVIAIDIFWRGMGFAIGLVYNKCVEYISQTVSVVFDHSE